MSHFRTPHESYLGKKLEHCPNCAAEVYWAKDKEGYEFWICTKCGEQYLFKIPFEDPVIHPQVGTDPPVQRKKWWLRTPTTTTNATPRSSQTSPTPVTPTMMPKSSAEGEHHTYEREEQIRHALRREAYKGVPKDLHISLHSKSSEPEQKDSQTNSQGQVCSACKGKTLTVGSPVTVKLQCPTEHEQWLENLERRLRNAEREYPKIIDRLTDLKHDNADLRKKVGYLEEDIRKQKFLRTYHQPVWSQRVDDEK